MNHIVIMGRMTRDPELRHTQQGIAVASFTLAVDRGFTPKDGERQTDFIDVVAWRNTAEFVSKYFVKGQLTAVSGRLQIRDWTDKDNNKRRNAEVMADNVYFTGDRRERDAASGGGYRQDGASGASRPEYREPAPRADSFDGGGYSSPVSSSGFAELDEDDGDLPF
ncbi:MAG: single-stranded DNA-binding protein [Oscillospiraceae bacterium]|jgi:single-strand DNA-binding protein|nr:single-stranded DNA-binding protein [Oscillospiraceae bacterium]